MGELIAPENKRYLVLFSKYNQAEIRRVHKLLTECERAVGPECFDNIREGLEKRHREDICPMPCGSEVSMVCTQ